MTKRYLVQYDNYYRNPSEAYDRPCIGNAFPGSYRGSMPGSGPKPLEFDTLPEVRLLSAQCAANKTITSMTCISSVKDTHEDRYLDRIEYAPEEEAQARNFLSPHHEALRAALIGMGWTPPSGTAR
jgi:hypothetical protein